MTPVEVLGAGAAEVARVLGPHGFTFVETGSGPSSGGDFASGDFRRGDRRLELHFRGALGLVTYHVGDVNMRHEDLTRAVRAIEGLQEQPEYPGFSDEPVDGFRHLGADLVRFGRVFTTGTPEEFSTLVSWVQLHPKPKGFLALE